jgi:hypothetical protein
MNQHTKETREMKFPEIKFEDVPDNSTGEPCVVSADY